MTLVTPFSQGFKNIDLKCLENPELILSSTILLIGILSLVMGGGLAQYLILNQEYKFARGGIRKMGPKSKSS